MPHGSIVESPKRKAQLGRDDLRHILVVDGDPMVCMAIEVYLQRNNFRVTIAEGGEAGLRALEHTPALGFLRMALELGAALCLRKPFTPLALLAAINDCLAEHRPRSDIATAVQLG